MPAKSSREVIAENVRRERAARHWTQMDLAEKAGVHHPRIAEIEAAKSSPRSDTIDKLADAFGIAPATLLTPVEAAILN